MATTLRPAMNIGPGQIIARNLEALNWSNKDLAEVLGMSEKSVSLLLNNKQSITVETAVLLGMAFNTSPEFWLNLDQTYRMRLRKEGKREKDTAFRAEVRKYLPIAEMRKKGWISCTGTAESYAKAALNFLGKDELDFSDYNAARLPFCARRGPRAEVGEDVTKYYLMTWYHKAQTEALAIEAKQYSREKLLKLASSISDFTRNANGVPMFVENLQEAGVKFFVLSHLEKTYLDGASFFQGENPVIVYTGRYNRLDNFWWTLAHEISHVILHMKDRTGSFLDDLDNRDNLSKQEQEADDFAAKLLNVKKLIEEAQPYKHHLSENRLIAIAESCGLEVSLALGILQHYGYLEYRSLSRYRNTILNLLDPKLIKG